jgi:predicted secreted protein
MRAFAILALTVSTLVIAPAAAKDKKPVDPNKKSCRHQDTTGSILGGKMVCHTSAEWSEIDAESDRANRQMRNHMGRSNGGT